MVGYCCASQCVYRVLGLRMIANLLLVTALLVLSDNCDKSVNEACPPSSPGTEQSTRLTFPGQLQLFIFVSHAPSNDSNLLRNRTASNVLDDLLCR